MIQGDRWFRFMKKTRGKKSRATVPLIPPPPSYNRRKWRRCKHSVKTTICLSFYDPSLRWVGVYMMYVVSGVWEGQLTVKSSPPSAKVR
jgi:hypothetical protein